ASQLAQRTSMRRMSQERSSCSVTAPFAIGVQKLGHPVPELNLVLEANSGAPQHTHLNTPKRFSSLSGLEEAGSGPCCRVTRYCSGVSCCFHSSADLRTLTGDWRACLRAWLAASWRREWRAVTALRYQMSRREISPSG